VKQENSIINNMKMSTLQVNKNHVNYCLYCIAQNSGWKELWQIFLKFWQEKLWQMLDSYLY